MKRKEEGRRGEEEEGLFDRKMQTNLVLLFMHGWLVSLSLSQPPPCGKWWWLWICRHVRRPDPPRTAIGTGTVVQFPGAPSSPTSSSYLPPATNSRRYTVANVIPPDANKVPLLPPPFHSHRMPSSSSSSSSSLPFSPITSSWWLGRRERERERGRKNSELSEKEEEEGRGYIHNEVRVPLFRLKEFFLPHQPLLPRSTRTVLLSLLSVIRSVCCIFPYFVIVSI